MYGIFIVLHSTQLFLCQKCQSSVVKLRRLLRANPVIICFKYYWYGKTLNSQSINQCGQPITQPILRRQLTFVDTAMLKKQM